MLISIGNFYVDVEYFFLKHTVLFIYTPLLKCSHFGPRKGQLYLYQNVKIHFGERYKKK